MTEAATVAATAEATAEVLITKARSRIPDIKRDRPGPNGINKPSYREYATDVFLFIVIRQYRKH